MFRLTNNFNTRKCDADIKIQFNRYNFKRALELIQDLKRRDTSQNFDVERQLCSSDLFNAMRRQVGSEDNGEQVRFNLESTDASIAQTETGPEKSTQGVVDFLMSNRDDFGRSIRPMRSTCRVYDKPVNWARHRPDFMGIIRCKREINQDETRRQRKFFRHRGIDQRTSPPSGFELNY